MRVLLVGTVPPPGGERARALAQIAADLVAGGDTVEILSPDPRSAAHQSGRLAGLSLALRVGLAARRFDSLVLRIEPGLPFGADQTRLVRAVVLVLLGLALRPWKSVTLRLDSPVAIPGGLGGRATRDLWSRAEVVVENEEDRESLLAVPWVTAERVVVEAAREMPDRTAPATWPLEGDDDLRQGVLTVVRARAESVRRLERARAELAGPRSSTGVAPSAFEAPADDGPVRFGVSGGFVLAGIARRLKGVIDRLPR